MRNTININQGWKFIREDAGLPTALPEHWKSGDLPHTWNAVDGMDGNGRQAVYHEGGYSSFRADVTELCREDGENLLAVSCDNSEKSSFYPQALPPRRREI